MIITQSQALTSLEEVVAEKGLDFRYQAPEGSNCVYVANGAPSCAVGLALAKLKVTLAVIESLDTANCGGGISARGMGRHLAENGIFLDSGAIDVFYAFQDKQDAGHPYATALNAAKERAA